MDWAREVRRLRAGLPTRELGVGGGIVGFVGEGLRAPEREAEDRPERGGARAVLLESARVDAARPGGRETVALTGRDPGREGGIEAGLDAAGLGDWNAPA